MFFLWHLANMSCMVPFWASTDSGSVPIWGPRPKPHRLEEVDYNLNDSYSHFTQLLFPPRVPQHTSLLLAAYTVYRTSFILIIHHINSYIHIFIYMSCLQFHYFQSSWQVGCSQILVSVTRPISKQLKQTELMVWGIKKGWYFNKFSAVSVGTLFVSVVSKHRNFLFWY